MGCTQGKYTVKSPSKALEKLKMENGYLPKAGVVPHRSSTGQKFSGRLNKSDSQTRKSNESFGSSGSGGEGKLSDEVRTRDGGRRGRDSQKAKEFGEEEVVDGWPKWLTDNVPKEVLAGLAPKSAEKYDKLAKVGQGTYSNVYKARDRETGKIVALKKVRFDTSEPQSVKFMAREITILQKLDHPNVVKLEGLATSRLQYSLYLVFDFMQSDLATIITRPEGRLTEPQVKCYMHQLLSGLQHCHDRGILHRDIKGANLLIDKNGMLKIADFGLANYYSPTHKHPLTSRVVTLWYRAPELLLGSTDYGVGIDLWSAGCLLAEMFSGRPVMPGRNEVEQLHMIFKLCGTPSDDYWKKLKLSTTFQPPKSYKPRLFEAFSAFPESSLGLLTRLLALDPDYRSSASSALQNEFFYSSPLACDLSGLPVIWREEDELAQSKEFRKHRNSKMRHRSRTQRERKRNDTLAESSQEGSIKPEEPEKIAELNIPCQEIGSSTSSSSSGTKPTPLSEKLPFLLSPVASPNKKMSPKTLGHPNATKNIKNLPPLPSSKTGNTKYRINNNNNTNTNTDNMYSLSQVKRSASTREFRKFSPKKHLELYAVDN